MEQEESKKDIENPLDVSSKPDSSEKDNKNDAENGQKESSQPDSSNKNTPLSLKAKSKIVKKSPAGKSKTKKAPAKTKKATGAGNMEQEESGKHSGNSPDVSSKPESSEKDKDAADALEGSSQPESSDKNIPRALNAKRKIVKKSQPGRLKKKTDRSAEGDTGIQEQEESRKNTENSPDMLSKHELLEKDNSNNDVELPKIDNSKNDVESSEKDNSKKDVDSSEIDNSKKDVELSGKDNGKKDVESSEKDNSKKDVGLSEKDNSKKDVVLSEKDNSKKDVESSEKDNSRKDMESLEKDDSKKDVELSEKDDSKKDVELLVKDNSKRDAESSEKDNSKKDVESSEKDNTKRDAELSEKDNSKKDVESSEKDNSKMDVESSEKDNSKMDVESSEKDNNKGAENAPEGSSQPESRGKSTPRLLKAKSKIVKKSQAGKLKTKKVVKAAQGNTGNREQEESKKYAENPPVVSSKPELSEKDNSKKDAENPPEGSSKPESSDKNTPRSLKANSKIVKKSQALKFKANKNKGVQQIQGKQRRRKNKKLSGNSENFSNKESYVEKKVSTDTQQKRNTDEQPEKSQRDERNREDRRNRSNSDKMPSQKNKEKHGELHKGAMSRKNKGRRVGIEKSQSNEKNREKLGGLIFMCNAKTKPDCFRYRVMGVSSGKKDIVFGVKPGLKLFLYDFDLKLLYGIYKASSSGGMKLEPGAFEGSFPAQVRFTIDQDCFPLPESIFKRAIKENYNEKKKFKTELTVRQVRKLTELFRPAEIRSALHSVHSPAKVISQDREVLDGRRGSRPHSHRERPARDHYGNSYVNSYNVRSHERDPRTDRREEIPRDLFLTEKDYRTYGLQGDRRIVSPPSRVNPTLDLYDRDYERERERLHRLEPIYRDRVPARGESLRSDPPYLNEAYRHGARHEYSNDPYHRSHHYGASSSRDSYMAPLSREEIPSSSYLVRGRTSMGSEHLRRTEAAEDRLYSTYAADALSDYNRSQHYNGVQPEATSLPVSSRYSFAGPSYSYR